MDDSKIFLTVTARNALAVEAFKRLKDNPLFVTATATIDNYASRENTPLDSDGSKRSQRPDLKYLDRVQLRFDHKTKRSGQFSFGSDATICDIPLAPKRGHGGISRRHFYITFVIIRGEYQLVLMDTSTNGSSVSYDGQAEHEIRTHFRWILTLQCPELTVHVGKTSGTLSLGLHLRKDDLIEGQYKEDIQSFISDAHEDPTDELSHLDMSSTTTSSAPSEALPANRRPIYLRQEALGSGSFGHVSEYMDASTKMVYAGKSFYRKDKLWAKEVAILRSITHEHIVRFVDLAFMPEPLLVMEYLDIGNLRQANDAERFLMPEMLLMLRQCLSGLVYLHAQNITHRDLKPENILLQSRLPPQIKLADFGSAIDRHDLMTFCGTRVYMAPEIFQQGPYTNAVDIWSLGVIIYEFLYGLACPSPGRTDQDWCASIVSEAQSRESRTDDLMALLLNHLLRLDPKERSPAATCLAECEHVNLPEATDSETYLQLMVANDTYRIESDQPTATRTNSKNHRSTRNEKRNFVQSSDSRETVQNEPVSGETRYSKRQRAQRQGQARSQSQQHRQNSHTKATSHETITPVHS